MNFQNLSHNRTTVKTERDSRFYTKFKIKKFPHSNFNKYISTLHSRSFFRKVEKKYSGVKKWRVFAKTGIPGHFGAKNRYILKPSTNHTPGALRLASVTSYLFLAWKDQVHLVLSTLSSFQLFLANFEPIRGHTLVPRHVSYDVS